jgi:hypothetical protein
MAAIANSLSDNPQTVEKSLSDKPAILFSPAHCVVVPFKVAFGRARLLPSLPIGAHCVVVPFKVSPGRARLLPSLPILAGIRFGIHARSTILLHVIPEDRIP